MSRKPKPVVRASAGLLRSAITKADADIRKTLQDSLTAAAKGLVSTNPKDAFGIQKPGISAVPASALFHLGQAMTEGRQKYGLLNWRESAVQSDIYFDAMMRHAWSWNDGEELADGPLKCHHLAHVMACAAILLDAQGVGMLIDNRGVPGRLPELIAKLKRET